MSIIASPFFLFSSLFFLFSSFFLVFKTVFNSLFFLKEKEESPDEEPSGEGDEEGKTEEGGEKKKKETRARKTKVVTLEKNPDNISLKSFDLEFAVDPLFR